MTGRELKEYRKHHRLTQAKAAKVLGVSQTYLSLLESEKRRLTDRLKKKLVNKMNVRPTELPAKTKVHRVSSVSDDQLTADLAALGYKGFSHWKPSALKNPADVLLSALKSDKRDARLVEALPWLVLQFPDMEWPSLVATARTYLLQNRLGFVTDVAKRVAEFRNDRATVDKLTRWEAELERSKLEREETLCNETMTDTERKWLQVQRSDAAKQWHLLTDLSPNNVNYYVT
jgi:transcriptional regulator with XRE-family HTH domain